MVVILFKSIIFNLLNLCINTFCKINKWGIGWQWVIISQWGFSIYLLNLLGNKVENGSKNFNGVENWVNLPSITPPALLPSLVNNFGENIRVNLRRPERN